MERLRLRFGYGFREFAAQTAWWQHAKHERCIDVRSVPFVIQFDE